jgi:hypothetical protein
MSLSDGKEQLPDDLEQEALLAMKKIGAFQGSNGDPAVMDSYKEPPSYFLLLLISAGLGLAAYIISEISNYYEIKRHWTHYRCMPSIAPFAKFYGYDLTETLNFCTSQAVKAHAPGVIDPIYKGINVVTGIVDGVYDKVVSIEGGVAGLLSGFEAFVVNFVNSFRLLGVRVRMSFVRMKDIFARVFGVFIAFAYSAISAITFGENLVCNPLVTFIGSIAGADLCCFSPETLVRMSDGSAKPIVAVRIGDALAGGSTVTSTYLFDGTHTTMVKIQGIHVSANHYIEGSDGRMIQVGNHSAAIPAQSLPRILCLSTSNNLLPIVTDMNTTLTFADYEESSDPRVIAEAQRIAEEQLNNGPCGPTVGDYSLGLDPTFQVFMSNGAWKPLSSVQIGDTLMGGTSVLGLVHELCESQCKTPGGHYVSAAQLVFYNGAWLRAAHVWPSVTNKRDTLIHLMVSNNGSLTVGGDGEQWLMRDYAEVSSMDIQRPYDVKLTTKQSAKVH